MAAEKMDYLFDGLDEKPDAGAVKAMEQKEKNRIAKLPKYGSKDNALAAAIQQNDVCEVWQEPDGGNFLVAVPDAYEALWRHNYKRVLDSAEIADLARERGPVKKAMTYAQARETK